MQPVTTGGGTQPEDTTPEVEPEMSDATVHVLDGGSTTNIYLGTTTHMFIVEYDQVWNDITDPNDALDLITDRDILLATYGYESDAVFVVGALFEGSYGELNHDNRLIVAVNQNF